MPEVTSFTDPLGGHEVVSDVLAQIKKRLSTDCNLRATDGYSGGYSGEVVIKLKLHAVRTSQVEMTIPITQSPEVKAPGPEFFDPQDVQEFDIHEEISIPLEPNLGEVRSRTEEIKNEVPAESEIPDENEGAKPRPKRQYTKRAALVGAVSGDQF
jgi:hypothetical protein